ncbi:MAG: B12-binding domain-containing radical SAM protein [Planctomycetes bacterium]|nr:B12-binding domain-containing radical SAM protein [Planctomycetota bacterium]
MRILLVQPAPFECGRIGLENALWMSEPGALTAIAACVEDEHEVRIIDMRLEEADVLPRVLASFKPDLVGVTCMTTDAYQAQAVLHCAKSILGEQVFTLLGGHHPTLVPGEHDYEYIDAICIGEGEDTFTELVAHLAGGGDPNDLHAIDGLAFRSGDAQIQTSKRSQARELDTFPAPARHLLDAYKGQYFFASAINMAAIQTSRGCAFDCNFCAIWEFYEKKVRFLSSKAIADRMEECEEPFIFFLDDNFLTRPKRLEELCDEIERRNIKKYWMIQGRTDFVVENPELMKRMRDCGLMMVLSGFETNDAGTLESLKKDNTRENNLKAAKLLNDLSIITTGIFMAHPDFEAQDFEDLYAAINEMKITIPLVVIHMPLPGTQSWRENKDSLLTEDARFFDLLHAVVPTKLPRREFYERYAAWNESTEASIDSSLSMRFMARRPRLMMAMRPGMKLFGERREVLRKALNDPENYLRDEDEIIGELPIAAQRASESVARETEGVTV